MKERITVGSMFTSIGGICLGFKQNGCELIWQTRLINMPVRHIV